MRPKGKLFALLAIFAAIGVVTATGAFTTVTASRTATVSAAGDRAALVAIQPAPTQNGIGGGTLANSNGYAQITSGTMEISITGFKSRGSGVNLNAVTDIEGVFNITNQGTQPVHVYISDTDDSDSSPDDSESEANAITFYNESLDTGTTLATGDTGYSLESSSNSIELDPGETLLVSFQIDTTGNLVDSAAEDIISGISITAEASGSSNAKVGGS